jgi:hypothetical protein
MARPRETMKRWIVLAALLATPVDGQDLLSRHKLQPGMYVWDGIAGGRDVLPSRIAALDASGFHAIRLLLSPAAQRSYALSQTGCRQLKCLFLSDAYQRALALKTVDTVMFTAYDFASYPRQHFLDPQFLKTNRQQVFDEYEELTEAIMSTYSGSGRVFIISHWEGDNQVYCGSSYDFQTVDAKHDHCLGLDPDTRLAGMTEWLRIRQEAIAEGRKRALAAGAANVEVYHAAEFNTIFATRRVSGATMRGKDYKGMLDTVIPAVHPDLCSYSAWESANRNRITKDLQDIEKACAPARVIVGEIGIKEDPDKRYAKMISALQPLKDTIPLVFFWQAFEGRTTRDPGFGLFDADGRALHAKAVEAIRRLH